MARAVKVKAVKAKESGTPYHPESQKAKGKGKTLLGHRDNHKPPEAHQGTTPEALHHQATPTLHHAENGREEKE